MRLTPALAALALAGCSQTPATSDPKVVGGRVADEYGFMAGVTSEGATEAFCGGAFIAPRVVLTAAHCVDDASKKLYVSAGLRLNSAHANAAKIGVRAVRVHPGYDGGAGDNDIALLFLDAYDATALPGAVQPVTLNTDAAFPSEANGEVTVIGWGNTTSFGNLFEDELRQVTLPVVPLATCKEAQGYEDVSNHQICAGDLAAGGIDSCQGDSGGPLVAKTTDGAHRLVGVVSWGLGCALAGKPGVYTRVSAYKAWIDAERATFESPHTGALPVAKLTTLFNSHCYALKGSTETSVQGTSQATVTRRYVRSGAFAAVTSSGNAPTDTAGDQVGACDIGLGNGNGSDRVAVRLATVGTGATQTKVLKADRQTPRQTWRAPVKEAYTMRLVCLNGGDPSLLNFAGSSAYVVAGGAYYDAMSVISGNQVPAGATVLAQCAVQDKSFRLLAVQQNDAVAHVIEMKAPFLGAQPRYLLAQRFGAGGGSNAVTLTLAQESATQGKLELANGLTSDIHTWRLACNFRFSLEADDGTVHQPQQDGDEFAFKFMRPVSALGTIGAGQKLAFKYTLAGAALPGLGQRSCTLNGAAVPLIVAP